MTTNPITTISQLFNAWRIAAARENLACLEAGDDDAAIEAAADASEKRIRSFLSSCVKRRLKRWTRRSSSW